MVDIEAGRSIPHKSPKPSVLGALVVLFLVLAVSLMAFSRSEPSTTKILPPQCQAGAAGVECEIEWGLSNLGNLDAVLKIYTHQHITDDDFAENCHRVWHAVGEAAGMAYDPETALRNWTYSCAGGFMHGVMSTAPRRVGVSRFGSSAATACASFIGRPLVVYLDCWHGIGHGYAHVLEFPESMYACKDLAPGAEEFDWCAWGAAELPGEAYRTDPLVRERYKSSLTSLCNGLASGHQACYRMVLLMMLRSEWNFPKMTEYCTSQSVAQRDLCARGLGQVAAAKWLAGTLDLDACARTKSLAEACAFGFGWHLARPYEWGVFDDDSDLKRRVASACVGLPTPLLDVCREAFEELRGIELSPVEERLLIETW